MRLLVIFERLDDKLQATYVAERYRSAVGKPRIAENKVRVSSSPFVGLIRVKAVIKRYRPGGQRRKTDLKVSLRSNAHVKRKSRNGRIAAVAEFNVLVFK